jgi:hypothetical protein
MINRAFNALVGSVFLIIYTIGHYEFPLLIPITIILNISCILFGFYVQKINEREAARVLLFVRIGLSARTILPLLLSITVYLSFEYFLDYYLDLSKQDSPFIYTVPLIIAMYFGMKHQNLINSIRIYQNGIKLPGPSSKIIHWENIKAVSRSKDSIIIQINNTVKKLKIVRIDSPIFDEFTAIYQKMKS